MVARTWKLMNEVAVQDLKEPMKIAEEVRNLVHSGRYLTIRLN